MTIELIGVIILSVIVAILLQAYERLLRKLRKMQSERSVIDDIARQKAIRLIEEAREQSVKIINQAQLEAELEEEKLGTELEKVSSNHINNYKDILQNISKYIESDAQKEIESFRKNIETGTIDIQKTIAEKINGQYTETEKKIEDYRNMKIAEIDTKVKDVVKEISNELIGKALNLEDQGELILKALKKAKDKYVL